jgi:hypothetical protein
MRPSVPPTENLLLQVPQTIQPTPVDSLQSSFAKDMDLGKFPNFLNDQCDQDDSKEASTHLDTPIDRFQLKEKSKKSVTFKRTVRYREIPHQRDIPEALKPFLWETSQSLRQFHKKAQNIASILNYGLEVPEECGERGLFSMLHSEKWKRTQRRDAVYRDMERLQEMQDDFRVLFDDQSSIAEMISRRCIFLSEQAQLEALKRGQEDEAAAQDLYA